MEEKEPYKKVHESIFGSRFESPHHCILLKPNNEEDEDDDIEVFHPLECSESTCAVLWEIDEIGVYDFVECYGLKPGLTLGLAWHGSTWTDYGFEYDGGFETEETFIETHKDKNPKITMKIHTSSVDELQIAETIAKVFKKGGDHELFPATHVRQIEVPRSFTLAELFSDPVQASDSVPVATYVYIGTGRCVR